MQIPVEEITLSPSVDRDYRLFSWNDVPYCAVVQQRTAFTQGLFDQGVIASLVSRGLLIDTQLTDHTLDGYGLVLKHKRVSFPSYPFEWNCLMLQDAALKLLDLEIELDAHNLMLHDGHAYNVRFDGPHPVFIGFCAIVPRARSTSWQAEDEFRRFFLNPLLLMSRGQYHTAHWLLRDYTQGVTSSDMGALDEYAQSSSHRVTDSRQTIKRLTKSVTPAPLRRQLKKSVQQVQHQLAPQGSSRLERLTQMRESIAGLTFPSSVTDWSTYCPDEKFLSFTPSPEWMAKQTATYQVLKDHKPATVLDLGSNRGWYAQLAASLGCTVAAVDVDEPSITQLYRDVRLSEANVLPLLVDFRYPAPPFGIGLAGFAGADKRLAADMVLVLALTHHLVFKQHLSFEQIVDGICFYTRRRALIEFIPPTDQYVSQWMSDQYDWYSLDNFMQALRARFTRIDVIPSSPEPRLLLLCEY